MSKKDYACLKLSDNNTVRLLQLYELEPCLYNINAENYKSRRLRKAALKRIAAALAVDGFGPKEVAAKFKNLRNSYSQEMKKVKDSEASGATGEDVYVPKVYWFEVMDSFIRPFLYSRAAQTNLVLKSKSVTKKETSPEHYKEECRDEEEDRTSTLEDQTTPSVNYVDENENKPLPKRSHAQTLQDEAEDTQRVVQEQNLSDSEVYGPKRKRSIPPSSEIQLDTCSTVDRLYEISRLAASMVSKKSDMYSHFGDYVASVLREKGGQKAVLIQRDICNVIFKHLSPHVSCKTTSPYESTGNGSSQEET